MSFLWFLLWCSFCCICFSLSWSRDRCALMPSTFPLKCKAVLLSLKNYNKQTIDEILSKSFQLQVITSVNIIRSGGYLSLLVANVMCNLLQWQLGKSSPSSVTRQAKVFFYHPSLILWHRTSSHVLFKLKGDLLFMMSTQSHFFFLQLLLDSWYILMYLK